MLSLLFIIILEALFRKGKLRSRCPEELLYTNDLALVSETIEAMRVRQVSLC